MASMDHGDGWPVVGVLWGGAIKCAYATKSGDLCLKIFHNEWFSCEDIFCVYAVLHFVVTQVTPGEWVGGASTMPQC